MNRIRIIHGAAFAALFVLAATLSGCVAEDPSAAPPTATPTPTVTYSNPDDWEAALNDCLRNQGFTIDSDGTPRFGPDEQDRFGEAYTTCETIVGPAPNGGLAISPQEQYALWTAVAECLRDLGYTVEDPALQPGGFWGFRPPVDATETEIDNCMPSDPFP
jgi:hypothetical protein